MIPDAGVIRFTYWAWGGSYPSRSEPPQDESYAEIYIGLTAFLAKSCVYNATAPAGAEMQCESQVIHWSDYEDTSGWSGKVRWGHNPPCASSIS